MSHYTATELRKRVGGITASAAHSELSHMEKSLTGVYDVFLSHSIRDELLVLGLKRELERVNLTVYVDWIEDPNLDRVTVSPMTAQTLRERMNSCRSLVYATSNNASASRWMPWELGYFDGHQGQSKVAICPIETGSGSIQGQEYLGIYKRLEPVLANGIVLPYVLKPSGEAGEPVRSFVHGRGQFVGITTQS